MGTGGLPSGSITKFMEACYLESGPDARPMKIEWVRALRDMCIAGRIAFYFKQWGGENQYSGGRTLDGRIWDEMPEPSGQLWLDGL